MKEKRMFPAELRAKSSEGGTATIVGHASVFNRMSDNLGGFYEIVRPGFFDDMLEDDVRALVNHDNSKLLARTKAGTLTLTIDDEGLHNEINADARQSYAHDLLISMERGDSDQQSFQFSMPADGSGEKWYVDDEGRTIRELIKGKRLYDVSIVTFPAYPDSMAEVVSARTLDKAKEVQLRTSQEAESANVEAREAAQASRDNLRRNIELVEAE